MEIKIAPSAEPVLDRNPRFKTELIEGLKTQRFAYICFISQSGKGANSKLEIRCLGGDGVLVPETAFDAPGTLERITSGLECSMK
ncbi:MAG: hypothetical protein FJ271_32050 [Planctomycetes bacterium]|nr:hypothetical protein [Planctomycetota bacterium]